MKRWLVLFYGLFCYAAFLATFLYTIGFVGNFFVPKSIDSPPAGAVISALLIDFALLALFALQHSVMARPTFKKWWTRLVPAPVERSTYVLVTCLVMGLLFMLWQPLGDVLWEVQQPLLRAAVSLLFACGWILILLSTFLINHFDLFGLRQVWLYYRDLPYRPLRFKTPGLYRYVRHPLYIGWLTVFWAAPTMTMAHFVFALAMTVYILIAIQFEERNLVEYHGEKYSEYLAKVPMLLPRLKPVTEEVSTATFRI